MKNKRKTAENSPNTKEFLWLEKIKEFQNTRERKIRVGNFEVLGKSPMTSDGISSRAEAGSMPARPAEVVRKTCEGVRPLQRGLFLSLRDGDDDNKNKNFRF